MSAESPALALKTYIGIFQTGAPGQTLYCWNHRMFEGTAA
jgi:hypothetical protein